MFSAPLLLIAITCVYAYVYICVMCICKYECICSVLYFVATCKRPFGPSLLNKMNEISMSHSLSSGVCIRSNNSSLTLRQAAIGFHGYRTVTSRHHNLVISTVPPVTDCVISAQSRSRWHEWRIGHSLDAHESHFALLCTCAIITTHTWLVTTKLRRTSNSNKKLS